MVSAMTARASIVVALLVGHDGGPAQQAVAEGVVAVVVGLDERAHRLGGHRCDRGEVGPGVELGGAGVYADHAAPPDQEPVLLIHHEPVGLDVGVDAVGDLLQPRVGRCTPGGGTALLMGGSCV
jgi:hypothetical protein